MKTGYQIYLKKNGEATFKACGLNNWFWNEDDAIAKCEALRKTWGKYGDEYIVVKLGITLF